MATMLHSRTHLRVQAAFSGSARLVPLRSVLVGSRQQPQRAGLQQQMLVPAPTRPIGLGMSGTVVPISSRQTTIMRSFLGVGAPEAILVAVVALVVFGPKGLADAAKSLGQTLRAFQPTIKEVVEVSQEIKGTLEQELGLDELRNAASMRPTPRPVQQDTASSTPSSSSGGGGGEPAAAGSEASSSSNPPTLRAVTEDIAKQLDPDIELKRAMSEQAAWGGQTPVAGSAAAAVAAAPAAAAGGDEGKATSEGSQGAGKDLSTLSLEDLEAELARRKKTA